MEGKTQVEAAGSFCPQSIDGAPSGEIPKVWAVCAGARCMAWRWTEDVRRKFHAAPNVTALKAEDAGAPACFATSWEFQPHDDGEGEPAGWVEPAAEADVRRRGYCGMTMPPARALVRLVRSLAAEFQ